MAPIPEHGEPVEVELGPGTETFTSVIQQRLGGRGRHLAIELNERLAARLARRFPKVEVLCADAAALPNCSTNTAPGRPTSSSADRPGSPSPGSGPTIIASDDSPSGMGGELLGACLALLVGVVGVMLLDRQPARRLIAVVLAAGRPRHRAWIRVRAPMLAQLCLLRT